MSILETCKNERFDWSERQQNMQRLLRAALHKAIALMRDRDSFDVFNPRRSVRTNRDVSFRLILTSV